MKTTVWILTVTSRSRTTPGRRERALATAETTAVHSDAARSRGTPPTTAADPSSARVPAPASPPMITKRLPSAITSSSTADSRARWSVRPTRCEARLPGVRPALTTGSMLPSTADIAAAWRDAVPDGQGRSRLGEQSVPPPVPPRRTVGGGQMGEVVVGRLGDELLPTLLGEDGDAVVGVHVYKPRAKPPSAHRTNSSSLPCRAA